MSRQDWCPQWAWDEADKIVGIGWGNQGQGVRRTFCERIARALLDAHQRGRREGMEEAAKIADKRANMATVVSHAAAVALLVALPDAIRAAAKEIKP